MQPTGCSSRPEWTPILFPPKRELPCPWEGELVSRCPPDRERRQGVHRRVEIVPGTSHLSRKGNLLRLLSRVVSGAHAPHGVDHPDGKMETLWTVGARLHDRQPLSHCQLISNEHAPARDSEYRQGCQSTVALVVTT